MSEATWLERKMNWIAVSDTLPPNGRTVLATDASGHVNEAYRDSKGKWRWSHGGTVRTATHWMELPNPPAQFELDRVAGLVGRPEPSSRPPEVLSPSKKGEPGRTGGVR